MQPQLGIRKRFSRSLSGVDRCSLSWWSRGGLLEVYEFCKVLTRRHLKQRFRPGIVHVQFTHKWMLRPLLVMLVFEVLTESFIPSSGGSPLGGISINLSILRTLLTLHVARHGCTLNRDTPPLPPPPPPPPPSSSSDGLLQNCMTLWWLFCTNQQHFTLSSAWPHGVLETSHSRTMASFVMPFSLLVKHLATKHNHHSRLLN